MTHPRLVQEKADIADRLAIAFGVHPDVFHGQLEALEWAYGNHLGPERTHEFDVIGNGHRTVAEKLCIQCGVRHAEDSPLPCGN